MDQINASNVSKESSKNQPDAIKRCLRTLFGGNVAAQRKLSYIYYQGLGVSQDYSKAFGWYLKAAKQGDDDAQSNLGYMYLEGKGISQDYSKAMDWCFKATEQGNAVAQSNLGHMYAQGQGVT
ncbi:hypothetical protein BCR41DRAFT_367175 [Lobosporangium transversale]|uniref:Sel1 repeat family protein n=1 Tax=Lobosporangium transversale TaxID=64571 RepID=A0A1Y2H3I4_9FUNG|nr:hypothetical protein BCR41DRAFT_367175 [Lobosporangium transversale]ORZ28551.1 hypothetical protein BCR41DRAFT_367175 [Lobosporangium transversale]|eukprot:XP_021886236.1 hypothetical protein BCR41DRAFT_367175 [Lobosporangium transversale]